MTALQGLKIIDFTRLLPGPLATMFLANMGAEVIKIESPQNKDQTRNYPPFIKGESANFMSFNHSKQSVVVDYTQAEGKEILYKLLEEADILIEQFRPNYLAQFGLDYHTLHQQFPQLIYVSLTGYGQTGDYANMVGHDLNYMAMAGGLGGNTPENMPQIPTTQIADIAGGSYMAMIGCLVALYARTHTHSGQWVDVAMMDGIIPLNMISLTWHWATGENPPKHEQILAGKLLNYNIYRTKDNRYVALGALEDKFWKKFCALIQKPDWVMRMYDFKNMEAHKQELQALFQTKNAQEWTTFGEENNLPITLIHEINELLDNTHIKQRQVFQKIHHPKAGEINAINFPIKFSETPPQIQHPSPKLGEHTTQYLKNMGVSDATIKELLEKGIIFAPQPPKEEL